MQSLKDSAATAKFQYKIGQITREEAVSKIQPYLDVANEKSIEIAKKYNQKPKKITLNAYLRSAH